jgi:hypothetical protein
MTDLAPVRAALDAVRDELEERYPLTLGEIAPERIRGDYGYTVDYVVQADRHGPMSLLDVCALEAWIFERTGFHVLFDTRPAEEASRAAAE